MVTTVVDVGAAVFVWAVVGIGVVDIVGAVVVFVSPVVVVD